MQVVSDYSSKLDLPRQLETVETIDANHMQMARCGDRLDHRYRAISGVIKQFLRNGLLEAEFSRIHLSMPQGLNSQGSQEEIGGAKEKGPGN